MWKDNHILPSWYVKQNIIKLQPCWAYFYDKDSKTIKEKKFPQGINPDNKTFTRRELYSKELEKQMGLIDEELKNRFDYYFSNEHFGSTNVEEIAKFVIAFIYYYFERSPSSVERTKIWDMTGDFIGINSAWIPMVWNKEFTVDGQLKGQITHCYINIPSNNNFLIGNNMWCRINLKDLYDVHKIDMDYGTITLLQIKMDNIYIMVHSPTIEINKAICSLIEQPSFLNKLNYWYRQNIIRNSDTYVVSTNRIDISNLKSISK